MDIECAVQSCTSPAVQVHVRDVALYGKVELLVCKFHFDKAIKAEDTEKARERARIYDDHDYMTGQGRFAQ